jgi:hypothetical protein
MVRGSNAKAGGQVGLAGAGWAEQHDVACFGEEPT